MKIPASRLKAWNCLFETKKGNRYTLTVFADTKQRAIKIATTTTPENMAKGDDPRKDKLIEIKRSYKDKLGVYYKGRSVNV